MEVFAARRQRVLDELDGAVAIVPASPVSIRNNDVEHEYRQDSDLYYLTGFDEPESVLLLTTAHAEHRAVLFLRDRDPEREQWDGERAGVALAKDRFGLDATFPIEQLAKRLPKYMLGASKLYYELGRQRGLDDLVLNAITTARGRGRVSKPWPKQIAHPELIWHEMRVIKDAHALSAMRRAADITAEGHARAMKEAAPGLHEYDMEAALRDVFRRNGCDRCAYPPIVGSGANATVLHYHANNRQMEDGDLLLIDAGCEYDYYACDVTRTFPVNGKFSAEQRAVYEVVLAAQEAAIAEVKPGSTVEKVHEVALRGLVEGMVAIGLLEGEVDALIESNDYRRYFMHRTSHWLGMDVHDVGAYFIDGKPRPFEPGMVLTVEPGIYVGVADEKAPEGYRGIGIRIEDDILVTEDGHESLTQAIPKTPEDVERACG